MWFPSIKAGDYVVIPLKVLSDRPMTARELEREQEKTSAPPASQVPVESKSHAVSEEQTQIDRIRAAFRAAKG